MVYVAHEAWDCLVCRWQGNTTWFCAKCGRRQDIATDAVRWGKFLMDATIVCHCAASNAADGHIHEPDGYVLCLHDEEEDGSECPNAPYA